MFPRTLKAKVGLYVALTLATTLLAFAILVVRHERDNLLASAASHVNQLSELVIRSTRFAMLTDRPDYVHNIIRDVASQQSIEKVRIFSKEGVIIDSTVAGEAGLRVDRRAEGCSRCHQTDRPLASVPQQDRARLFTAADGRRMLASMEVIRNEPSCSNGGCHAHSPGQTVLGVLDIVYPLDEIDRTLTRSGYTILGLSLAFVAAATCLLAALVHRLVYLPLRDLGEGSARLAAGDLDQAIPVRADDELGRLARAFNGMMAALRGSRGELEAWGRTLEQKVAERTRALRLAEAEAIRGEKLASVGLLAAGIAHELNNPLTGVLTFSVLMRRKFADGTPEAEDLDLVIRETRRCAAIIRRLLDFAREKAPEKAFADLNALVAETVRIVERPAHLRQIAIALELDPALPRVWVDADLVRQVVMNILVNAEHAIEEKGSIVVRTRVSAEPKSPEPGAKAVPMAEIDIVDTGCGIAPGNLRRIFDPFFTTKGPGKGTGLGLSVSHGIVRAHGGLIEVESVVDEGTTFRVYLPLEAEPARAERAPAESGT